MARAGTKDWIYMAEQDAVMRERLRHVEVADGPWPGITALDVVDGLLAVIEKLRSAI